MPPKIHRKLGQDQRNKKGRISERSSSFHVRGGGEASEMLPRPRTVPDLLSGGRSSGDVVALITPPKLTKLLLNVTIQRSLGAVRVVLPLEATAEDLIAAALRQYEKEARLPLLRSNNASGFDLHYSQFCLESLDRGKKLIELGSRNFFLCPNAAAEVVVTAVESVGAPIRCSKEANEGNKKSLSWFKFMEFSL